jgi:hypothetical protein
VAIGAPLVGTSVSGSAGGTSVTMDITFATVGEWAFVAIIIADSQASAPTAPSGWTITGQGQEGPSGSASSCLTVYQRRKQAGDTTFLFTWPTTRKFEAITWSWPGLDPATPVEGATYLAHSASSTSYATNTVTPTRSDRWIAMVAGSRGTTSLQTWTPDAAMTERIDVNHGGTTPFDAICLGDTNAVVSAAGHSYTAVQSVSDPNGGTIAFALIPAGSGAIAPQPVRRRATPQRRAVQHATTTPPAQLTAPRTVRPARRTPTPRPRARMTAVPQAQAAPVAPTYVPPPVHHLLRLVARMRGRSTQAPIAQTVPPVTPYVAPPSHRLPRLLSAWTRGRRTSSPIAQIAPPPRVIAPRLWARRLPALLARRRPAVAPPVQATVPVPTPRRRLPLPARRPRVARVMPPQVVVVAPQRPPQPWRRRLLAALFGSRRGSEITSTQAQVCETSRPSTGATVRPDSGTTAYATAATARPSTGVTTRPDTGITDDPC